MNFDRLKSIFIPDNIQHEAATKVDVLLTQDEYIDRIKDIRTRCVKNGPIKVQGLNGEVCKISYISNNTGLPRLEFRNGDKKSVEIPDNNFEQLTTLKSLTQIVFGSEGNIYEIVQADLRKQAKTIMGPMEYEGKHRVYAKQDCRWNPSIATSVGAMKVIATEEGPIFDATNVEVVRIDNNNAFLRSISEIESILNPKK
jgi:hypothetical protein